MFKADTFDDKSSMMDGTFHGDGDDDDNGYRQTPHRNNCIRRVRI